MIKKFAEKPSNASRAVQIWQILVSEAHNRQTITYGDLAKILGLGGAGVLAHPLGHIMYFCSQNSLPPLTALVVNSVTGIPGEGLEVDGDLNVAREKVFNYDWYGLYPPSENNLMKLTIKLR